MIGKWDKLRLLAAYCLGRKEKKIEKFIEEG